MSKDTQPFVTTFLTIIIAVSILLMCTGCTTPPVIPKFPEAPTKAGVMVKCPDLSKLKENSKLSEITETITMNYSTYYECAVKVDYWIEWYQVNRMNYEKINK